MRLRLAKQAIQDTSGQGLTEYGAVLALVATLVALTFSFNSGSSGLGPVISQSFSSMQKQLDDMNKESQSLGGGGGT